ncbi:GAF and ANTAR domain-containing protein [Amycolatopsis sp. TRM77291]
MTFPGATQCREKPEWTAITRELLAVKTIPDAVRVIAETAGRLITSADLITVALCDRDAVASVPGWRRPLAAALDLAQHRDGGPAAAAIDPRGPGFAVSDDLLHDTRWPAFAALAGGHGLHAVVSVECRKSASGRPSGSLTAYSHRSGGLTGQDRRTALVLASQASLTLARLHTSEEAERRRSRLLGELEIRDIIGQAAGILMNRHGCTAEVANGMLRRWARELGMDLPDLAHTLLEIGHS